MLVTVPYVRVPWYTQLTREPLLIATYLPFLPFFLPMGLGLPYPFPLGM